MEELTIEQKAKRYDEILARANGANLPYYKEDIMTKVREFAEYLLPELKESEDDKIRKALIFHFQGDGYLCNKVGNIPNTDILAWLKKQKEFVSADFDDVWETADCEELTAPLEKYSKEAIKKMCHAWYDKGIELERRKWLEKQGEKDNLSIDFVLGYLGIKPAYKDGNAWCILLGDNIQEGICGFGDTKEEALIAFIKELIEKQSEKKPNPYSGTSFECNGHTWGMCARDGGVEILIDGHLKGRVFTNDSNAKEMFIKALERVEEQNSKGYKLTDCDKNSWWEDFKAYTSCTFEQEPVLSEEDENWLIDAINVCELHGYDETAGWLKNRLKSLKPQTTWKPSDEQMDSIDCAVRKMKESACYDSELVSLFNDLKKLKA